MNYPRCFIALLAATSCTFAELDLMPVEHSYEFEGVSMSETQFRNGNQIIRYEPPPDWTLQGSGSLLTMQPASAYQARGTIRAYPKPAMADFSEAAIKELREKALQRVPKGATETVVLSEVKNPLRMNRHETWEIIVQFNRGDQKFKHSSLVCNFQDNQMWFELNAPAAEFSTLHTAFQKSLFTLQGLD